MTEPANPWQADNHPPVQPWTPPPGYPPPGWGWPGAPPPPRRPWYRAPGTLAGAATFSAVSAWITLGSIGTGYWLFDAINDASGFDGLAYFLLFLIALPFIGLAGLTGFTLTLAGAAATVPLAVLWFRDPQRSSAAGLHLAHAVVAWAVLAVVLVWLPL